MRYSEYKDPSHPLASKKGYVLAHRAVLFANIGPGSHPCHVCGVSVEWSLDPTNRMTGGYLVADHLNFKMTDNRPENLAPACGLCNITRKYSGVNRGCNYARISCANCEKTFRCKLTCIGDPMRSYCSRSCATSHKWKTGKLSAEVIRHATPPKSYRMVTVHGHPLGDKKGHVAEHRMSLYAVIGEGPHKCHWCKMDVNWRLERKDPARLVVDHLDNCKLNNDSENLVPSCNPCNIRRAHFKDLKIEKPCEECGVTFIVNKNRSIANPKFGRFCGRSCRSKSNKRAMGLVGRNILPGEEFLIKGGVRCRASHRACLQCGADFLYATAGYKPKFCSHQCYGQSMAKKKSGSETQKAAA